MRADSNGLFWETAPEAPRERPAATDRPRVLPPWRDTGWQPLQPHAWPSLSAAKLIAVDTETCDPELTTRGCGAPRGAAYVVGLSVAVDGWKTYFPIRHAVQPELNLPVEAVLAWARDNLCNPRQPKVGANLLYDLLMLSYEGVHLQGDFHDVLIAEPLLDENNRRYNLGGVAQKWLGEDKVDQELYGWCAAAYGGLVNRKQAANIWRAPPALVGPYAEADADLPLRAWPLQYAQLEREGLLDVYSVERRLLPMLLAMRRRGVRVDVDAAKTLDTALKERVGAHQSVLNSEGVSANSASTIAAYCDRKRIVYPRTELRVRDDGTVSGGNPSFVSKWLDVQEDPVLCAVQEVRRLEKMSGTFLEGYIRDFEHGGRIYCEFNQLRSDDYGTVSGRFSSSNPNLQNIPARDEELGPLIRGLFLPDEDEDWYSDDYSQIEYRLLVHYGIGAGAAETRQAYWDDPHTDFHKYVAELTGIPRKPAKNINFGLVYGMGEPTMAANLGRTLEEVKPMFETYHTRFPFIRNTYNEAQRVAGNRGYVRTLLGRRRRFVYFEPRNYDEAQKHRDKGPFTEAEAVEKWGKNRIRRAFTHKSLNAILQGGAADIMKKAMVDIWESGVCVVLGAPLLTVHDELNWSVRRAREAVEAHAEALRIMESCVKLTVPLKVESGNGPNWGSAK